MKAAVLSDIHANIHALEAVIRDCEEQKTDTFWLLGDYVDYGVADKQVLELLQSLGAEHVISGNHDACLFLPDVRASGTPHGQASYKYLKQRVEREPEAYKWLSETVQTPSKIIDAHRVMLVHGTVNDPYWGKFSIEDSLDTEKTIKRMEEKNADILFFGHTHTSLVLTVSGKTIVNPGSVGQPRNGCPHAQYAVFQDGNIELRKVAYDIDATANEIKAAGLPDYLWQRLYTGK